MSGQFGVPGNCVLTHRRRCSAPTEGPAEPVRLAQESAKQEDIMKLKLEELRVEMKEAIDHRLDVFAKKLDKELPSEKESTVAPSMGAKNQKKEYFNEKKFVMRESLLTDLFNSTHIKTIYNFFLAILVLLILNTFIHDLLDEGKLNLTFDMIWWCFGKMPIVITIWVCMFFSTVWVLYPAFHFWAHIQKPPGLIDSVFWIFCYILYICALLYFPIYYLGIYELPIASSIIVVCEQVRFIMKVHAFVRETIPKTLKYKAAWNSKDQDAVSIWTAPCPAFEKFLYFLFVPTLIYRDEYPRKRTINWRFVASNFSQVLGSLFYAYFVFSRFCVPVFQDFNREHITIRTFVLAVFSSIFPGGLCLLLLFWTLLHAWMNAFAEMLRFGDRMFYKDWWNSTSFAGYYRTWNAIIHDWLYAYVYRDLDIIFHSRSRGRAAITVFFLSSFVHEYLLVCAFRFFYPVLFVLFSIFGVLFFFLTSSIRLNRVWNVMMWFNLLIGNGMIMALYSMEWYARINCPPTYDNFLDLLVPRSWTCQSATET